MGDWTGPEGERGEKMREKGWEERGPKAHSKNSDFGTPLIYVLFSGLPIQKQARKELSDTIATSIARYEKYRC